MARGDAKHSNGRLFRFLTGSPYRIDKQYSVGLRAVTVKAISRSRGMGPTQTITEKSCSNPTKGPLQPFFRNKKSQNPYLQTHVFLPHLSSSSDLRIVSSHTAFSGFPNDRLSSSCRCLHAYSGGTVRDSHPVFYSPAGLLPRPQALKRNIYLRIYDTQYLRNCQSKKNLSVD